jgi:hypothetical protein
LPKEEPADEASTEATVADVKDESKEEEGGVYDQMGRKIKSN